MAQDNQKLAKKRAAAIEAYRGGDLQQSRELLDWVTRKNPQDWEAWNMLGAIAGMQGDFAACESCCRRVLGLQPAAFTTLNNLGNALKNQGRLEAAAEAYGKALILRPDYLEARNNLGDLLRLQGDTDAAGQMLREVVRAKPDYAAAHNNLGVLLLGQGELEAALDHFMQASRLDSSLHDAVFNLGCVNMSLGRLEEAVNCFRNYVSLQPGNVAAWKTLCTLLAQLKHYEQAVECGNRAVALDPQDADARFSLGCAWQTSGNADAARAEYQMTLQLDPQHSGAGFFTAMLDGQVPESAPQDYVRKLFDTYAHKFDNDLVKNLAYHTPEHISRLLRERADEGDAGLVVLDLGCGTGLVGPLIRDFCTRLVGVDLSPEMIGMARRKGVYDELIVGDVLEPMQPSVGQYDAIIAADVFVYIGNLDSVFVAAWRALRPNGSFVFSTELEQQGDGYVLRETGRYGHSDAYIRRLGESTGFTLHSREEVDLRMEAGAMIHGAVYVFIRP